MYASFYASRVKDTMCIRVLKDMLMDMCGLKSMVDKLLVFPFLYLMIRWNFNENPIHL